MEIYDDGKNKYEIDIRKKVENGKEYFVITVDGFPYIVDAKKLKDGRLEFSFGGETFKALVTKDGDYRLVFHEGHSFKVKKTESGSLISDDQGLIATKVVAPMPGVIIQYLVKEGDLVKANQKVLIIEAMKMQTTLVAPYEGTVNKINFKPGDQVAEGVELLTIDKKEEK
jgi:3-methylcrotonyl-CoA carboxylase alpha subunit